MRSRRLGKLLVDPTRHLIVCSHVARPGIREFAVDFWPKNGRDTLELRDPVSL